MCGIVGVLGNHEVSPIIVEALKRLEYRGYDSAGIATIHNGALDRRRAVGKLINLSDRLVHDPLPGKSGIGHTRWATHGAANEANAHPHRSGPVAVVHNGIIENYAALRDMLKARNLGVETDTDTETVALMVYAHMLDGAPPADAVRQTLDLLHGAFALAFLFDGHPDLMIAARKGPPLAIGHGTGEMFVGSDAIALAPLTDRITYLEEGDWAVLTRDSVEIFDADHRPVHRAEARISTDTAQLEKGGHRHWMAKEIAEQPAVLQTTLDAYLGADDPLADLDLTGITRIVMIACGSAYLACLTSRYWIEHLAGIPVEVDVASEFRYREPPLPQGTLALVVSQSGETADTLAALRFCTGKVPTIAIVNVPSSTIAREADIALPTLAGVEIGVASTKAFVCQMAVLAALALKAAAHHGSQGLETYRDDLRRLPALLALALNTEPELEAIARQLSEARDILFLGRGAMFPMALEGALKLKEISYIHAEGYAAGELKHGPIALVDEAVPVIVFAPSDPLFGKTVSNMQEVMARGGKVVLITDADGAKQAGQGTWRMACMPQISPLWAPILYAIPAQLLAYHTALAKGTDVDQPRNLAKSVTVE